MICSMLHYPPHHSTSKVSNNIISKINLWINLWITISKGTFQTIISDQMYLNYTIGTLSNLWITLIKTSQTRHYEPNKCISQTSQPVDNSLL